MTGVSVRERVACRRVVGGVFGLALDDSLAVSPALFMAGNAALLASARGGLALLIDRLEPGRVWLPSYLCGALLQPLEDRAAEPRFYAVDGTLTPESGDWIKEVRRGDVVVIIDYFGMPIDRALAVRAKAQGAWIVEDACQALLSKDAGACSDFVLYSPRKFVGVPDGGILVSRCEVELDARPLPPAPLDWWLGAARAAILRDEFDRWGGERRWFELFQAAEAGVPAAPSAMSEISRRLLESAFDWTSIAERRRGNYARLSERLCEFALFLTLPDGAVPLGFPVRLQERDRIRKALFAEDIYPPVHWPIRGIVPECFAESHALAREILTLPCDQRYDTDDMDRMAEIVRRSL